MSDDGGLVCVTSGCGSKLLLELGDGSAGMLLLCDDNILKFIAAAMKSIKVEGKIDEFKTGIELWLSHLF